MVVVSFCFLFKRRNFLLPQSSCLVHDRFQFYSVLRCGFAMLLLMQIIVTFLCILRKNIELSFPSRSA